MKTRIPLVVRNIDLDDDETIEQLALSLSDLGWQEAGGQTIATVYTTSADPVADAMAAASHICRVLPRVTVERVDEQFVSLADIAARAGLSHEAVRLWATGKRRTAREPFPPARTQVGQGRSTSKIWVWPEVLTWLKEQYCLDLEPGNAYLNARQVARLNAALHEPKRQQWQRTDTAGVTRTLASLDEALQEDTAIARRFATQDACP
ncbi:hypothetical protein [Streptomyces sp. NRRL F-5630]|uniref:hypothetical protein n=1 Tax=Streptomyces sp. NRRL F-5630 TaxID=1463864 RepID=UPI003EB8A4A3